LLRIACLCALVALALVPAAAARPDAVAPAAQLPPVTATTFLVSGRGWGHGVGMSQYGALALANDGAGYEEILTHYYTGVTLGAAPVARVRVLVVEAKPALTVSSTAAFRVRDAFGKTTQLPAGSVRLDRKLEVTVNGQPQALAGPLVFLPGAGAPLAVDGVAYRGQVSVAVTAGKLDAVNDVGLEQYLYGVVPREMPAAWATEALKAQAVAARSYALAHRVKGKPFDLYADVRSQVYGGIRGEHPRTTAAIDATAGQVMLFDGRIVNALFHSTSGGRTASAAEVFGGDVPYLVGVDDPGSALSPVHAWGPVPVTDVAVRKGLKLGAPVRGIALVRSPSGRVATATVTTTVGKRSVRGNDLRSALGLRSTWVTSLQALSLTRPGGPVVHGNAVLLTAEAKGAKDVVLAQRVGPAWQPVASRPAGAKLSAKVRLTAPATFRLTAGRLGGPTLRVPVAPRVSAKRDAAGVAGTVVPAQTAGAIRRERLEGEAWLPVPDAVAAGDEAGAYRIDVPLASGSYRVRVAPAAGYAQGLSAVLRVP